MSTPVPSFCFLLLPPGLQNPVNAAVLAVILLLSKTVCAILDNVFASAHATTVGDRLLYHPVQPSLSSSSTLRDLIEARIIVKRTLVWRVEWYRRQIRAVSS